MTTPKGTPQIEVVDITPALAEEMLAHNTHNRNLRRSRFEAYARDMTAGVWMFNGDPIRLDTNGNILDGQHRLHAIVNSGVTIPMVVIRGLQPAVQETVDSGIPRKFNDMLQLRGETQSALLAAIVRGVYHWEHGQRDTVSWPIKPTNPELFATLVKYPDLRAITQNAGRIRHHCEIPGSVIGMLWWVFGQIDANDADDFFERLGSDLGHREGDPVYELRGATNRAAASSRGRPNRAWMVGITIKAWNAYRAGEKVRQLKYSRGGSRPDKFPEPQ